MKLKNGLYLCGFCNMEIKHRRISVSAAARQDTLSQEAGRHTVTVPLICPKCLNYVSQKDKDGFK